MVKPFDGHPYVFSRRCTVLGVVVLVWLSVAGAARAQTALPATTCDAAVANGDLHFPTGMVQEDGTKAFTYGDNGPFVSGGGPSITLSFVLKFAPEEEAVIKLAALDESCGGPTSAGTVFTASFTELKSERNTITFDAANGEVGINGEMQKATFLGTPRYLYLDVWDGDLPAAYASYSYVIDLQNPLNPGLR